MGCKVANRMYFGSLGVGLSVLFLVSSCTAYEIGQFDAAKEYCDQQAAEATGPAPGGTEFEMIPLEQWKEVFALKELQGNRVMIFNNELQLDSARIYYFYDDFLLFKRLAGANIVVIYDVNTDTKATESAKAAILERYPDAEFMRPWMREVRVVPVSPWLIRREALVPCQGMPMEKLPIQFVLDRAEALTLADLDDDAFVLGGTLSFYDVSSEQFFSRTFSLRKSSFDRR